MFYRDLKSWSEHTMTCRLGIVYKEIHALENERGQLMREQDRRITELARVKRKLTSG
jgi:hypothetical protein